MKLHIKDNIKNKLDAETAFFIEKIGIPDKIGALGGIFYTLPIDVFLVDNENIVIAENKLTKITHYLIINSKTKVIYQQWNYDEQSNLVFINSSYKQLIISNYVYFNVIKKLIFSESLGAYYDNSPEGGNFEKYANVLEMLIKDIDERATKEGVWHSLIEEMKLGVI